MASTLSHNQRARRYLQASMSAGYTGLPTEHREAYQQQMSEHERAYPRVREHALAGAGADFDQPLTPGEREHQTHLRARAGLEQSHILALRDELRGRQPAPTHKAPSSRTGSGPRSRARAKTSPITSATGPLGDALDGGGNLFMQAIGLGLGLTLIYLLVAGKGAAALRGISSAVVAGVGAVVKPVDPIAHLESALSASPISGQQAAISELGEGTVASGGTAGPLPGRVYVNRAGQAHSAAATPAAAAALTWPSLQRQIRARRLTVPQVQADLNILTGNTKGG